MENEPKLESKPQEISIEEGIKMVQLMTEQLKALDPQKNPEEYERVQKKLEELNEQGFEIPLGTLNR